MKTSNKLLIGMYLFIVVLLFFSYILVNRNAEDSRYKLAKETLIFNTKIDSLVLNINNGSKVKITKGDDFLVNYIKGNNFSSYLKKKTLYVDCTSSLGIEIPDSILYIYVFAKECQLYDFNQDTLSLEGLGLKNLVLNNSDIKALNINTNSSRSRLNNTNIERLNVNLQDNSFLRKNNNSKIHQINGLVDSTSTINITGIRKINL